MADARELITDAELAAAFDGSDFGGADHRKLLEVSVLKKAVGYHCGWTITQIMVRLGLIRKNGLPSRKGQRLLQLAYNDLMINQGG
ncbi:hypothetical protein [Corticimicrobacter populi]|uniref:Uncharacterized protein n=1 Tax=Corticimicrobacter populi TaxID=2175229 RepID=A0A2V1K604_9BURK|nr:hypothetical protein [Corticimicrobacter populi]PWF25007.1 hypothetical protein DD235_02215 [Corticimicrobacter populi]